ncbi:MAG: GNAT family N-acetyltransferase, partial [Terriglobales bacterium]
VETLLQTGKNPHIESLTTISVPAQIYDWKASAATRSQAKGVQDHNREQFVKAFADKMAVLGYERDAQGSGKFLLGRWEEKWMYPAT